MPIHPLAVGVVVHSLASCANEFGDVFNVGLHVGPNMVGRVSLMVGNMNGGRSQSFTIPLREWARLQKSMDDAEESIAELIERGMQIE